MPTDMQQLQGTWNVMALEIEGRDAADFIGGSKIIVAGDRFTTVSMGATYEGVLSIDPGKTPKTFDLNFTEGPEKGNRSLGIYELEGDAWTICLTISGDLRPENFATTPGSGFALETLRRETAKIVA